MTKLRSVPDISFRKKEQPQKEEIVGLSPLQRCVQTYIHPLHTTKNYSFYAFAKSRAEKWSNFNKNIPACACRAESCFRFTSGKLRCSLQYLAHSESRMLLIDLPLLFLGMEVRRERQFKFMPSTKLNYARGKVTFILSQLWTQTADL